MMRPTPTARPVGTRKHTNALDYRIRKHGYPNPAADRFTQTGE